MASITILNGKAKSHAAVSAIDDLTRRWDSTIHETSKCGDAAAFARSAVESGSTRVVIAGGDGTVSEVVQGLSPDFPTVDLGIIPLGTGNDLARSLDVPINDVVAAAEMAFTAQPTQVDVVRVKNGSESYFVNAASGGFGSQTTYEVSAESKKSWGAFAYWMAALKRLGDLTEYDVVMEIEDGHVRERIYGLAVNNGQTVGGGFAVAPSARLNDGLLDITIVPILPALQLLAVGVDLSLGRRFESEKIESFRTKSFHLRCEPQMLFSLDGEIERRVESHFEVLPRRLHFACGPNAAVE